MIQENSTILFETQRAAAGMDLFHLISTKKFFWYASFVTNPNSYIFFNQVFDKTGRYFFECFFSKLRPSADTKLFDRIIFRNFLSQKVLFYFFSNFRPSADINDTFWQNFLSKFVFLIFLFCKDMTIGNLKFCFFFVFQREPLEIQKN